MQETKEYLKKAYKINLEIETRKEVVDGLRATLDGLKGIDYRIEKVQGGVVESEHLTEKICKIHDLEKNISYLHDLLYKINSIIDELENPDQRLVLRMRYILNFTWDSIAEKMNFSRRQVRRIHDEGVKKIKNKMSHNALECH